MQTARSGFAEPPLITVVVLTHNRCDELMNTLDRLQGLPEKPEIIVVDNASTDDTARRLAERNPPVRVIRRRNNAGAAGRNDGVVAAHTPFVAFADDDSWWEAGAFRSAISFLQAYPRVGLLCAELRLSGHGVSIRPAGKWHKARCERPACRSLKFSAFSPVPSSSGSRPFWRSEASSNASSWAAKKS